MTPSAKYLSRLLEIDRRFHAVRQRYECGIDRIQCFFWATASTRGAEQIYNAEWYLGITDQLLKENSNENVN